MALVRVYVFVKVVEALLSVLISADVRPHPNHFFILSDELVLVRRNRAVGQRRQGADCHHRRHD